MIAAVLAGLALAGPAAAQDGGGALDSVRACFEAAGTKAEALGCAGTHVRDCTATSEGGETTTGIVACAMAETEAWDRILDEVWADLVILAKRRAIRDGEAGVAAADHEAMLRAAQGAWIAFRDADCAQEHGVWGEGSMARIAGAFCMLDRSAIRAAELRAKRDAFGDG